MTGRLSCFVCSYTQQLVIPLQEFASIRLDYERRSREKKLTDATYVL